MLQIFAALRTVLLAQSALMPEAGVDHSAVRTDVDVWGWSRDFTEMAALGSAVQRYPLGKQRGEAYILIFDVGATEPKQNVHVHYVTQADMPHDPVPLADIRDNMWLVEFDFLNLWPRRPVRKKPAGAMQIETIWEAVPAEPGICKPAVGFILAWKGQRRYQPHAVLALAAPCAQLRLSDARTYWAKKDLGTVMARFDYSSDSHEKSWRFPLAPAWRLGKALELVVRAGGSDGRAAAKKLERFGRVKLEGGQAAGAAARVDHRAELALLAQAIARELGGAVGEVTSEADIVVAFGPSPVEAAAIEPIAPAQRPDPELERLEELDRALDEAPNPLKR